MVCLYNFFFTFKLSCPRVPAISKVLFEMVVNMLMKINQSNELVTYLFKEIKFMLK